MLGKAAGARGKIPGAVGGGATRPGGAQLPPSTCPLSGCHHGADSAIRSFNPRISAGVGSRSLVFWPMTCSTHDLMMVRS